MRSPSEGPRRDDRGSATVWAVACSALISLACLAVLALAQVVEVRHRAAGAADLAALAGADRALAGPERACALAGEVAGAQGARVVRCAVDGAWGEVVDLTAEVRAGPYRVRVRSRAGPPAAAVR
ncbi:flp pilus-assembly TadE/G-like family protein [Streptomyces sp. ACA25]|uniref:Rv3654c family TadE-like protein n=1 Tax=Streptomyces sp. ACA25 TaxID=3022596 RepID=UPI00230807C0|nr:Rv3654c family TadE-like protein [Streptomyces sp. ACA25]MDB1086527.1 flp pilus-assembly TadE/G-like family protein [Streptomyces sp. ACA25]